MNRVFFFLAILTSFPSIAEKDVSYTHVFLDSLSTQINVGYSKNSTLDSVNNILKNNGQNSLNYSGQGMHAAIILLDEFRLTHPFYIGARAGAELWSNLSGTSTVTSIFPNNTLSYSYQQKYGFFADITLDYEVIDDLFDIYGFIGAGYTHYQLTGTNIITNQPQSQFRSEKILQPAPRAGFGFSYTFNTIYLIGLEYIHTFNNSRVFNATGINQFNDNLNHHIVTSTNTIDLTIGVYMNT